MVLLCDCFENIKSTIDRHGLKNYDSVSDSHQIKTFLRLSEKTDAVTGTTKGAKLPESRKEHMSVFCYVSGHFRISINMTIASWACYQHYCCTFIFLIHSHRVDGDPRTFLKNDSDIFDRDYGTLNRNP